MKPKNPFDGIEVLDEFGDLLKGFAQPKESAFQKEMRLLSEKMKAIQKR